MALNQVDLKKNHQVTLDQVCNRLNLGSVRTDVKVQKALELLQTFLDNEKQKGK